MGSIRVLDKLIANMIAAGEVVERPSSVVKELFENSLDAGANRITVEIKEGGREFIKVTDDGCGMDNEDAELCLVRYATSKLKTSDELYSIKTMGFRGEALASISSVAKVTLSTRKIDNDSGTKIVCNGGEITEKAETGCPVGTSVTVESLFFNTPARFKFMKKSATEGAYIEELVGKLILANPGVSVRFIKDGREIFYSKGDGDLKSAVYTVYGRAVAENIIFVDYERDCIKIKGCVGNPNIAKPTLKYENFCVNGRICRTKTMVSALEYGYFQKIAQGKHPFCALNISLDYSLCDVNMHPRKAEVKFSDEGLIYRVLSEAVSKALNDELYVRKAEPVRVERPIYNEKAPTFEAQTIFKTEASPEKEEKSFDFGSIFKQANDFTFLREGSSSKEDEENADAHGFALNFEIKNEKSDIAEDNVEKTEEAEFQISEKIEASSPIPEYRIAGQVFKTYIIIETADEMLLLDQHAAHERINYEMLRESSKKGTSSQILLVPKIIKLPPSDYRLALANKELFRKLGFETEDFSDNCIIVRAIPTNTRESQTERLIYEILNETSKAGNIRNEEFNQRLLYMIACKMSVKANTELSSEEADALAKKAFSLRGNTTCPHGRPLFISFPKSFIEGKFER